MLFGVADHKLDLVAQPVAGHNLLGWLRQVGGGEHQAVTGGGFAEHHHPQVASEVRAVGQSGPDLDIRAIREATDLLKEASGRGWVVPVHGVPVHGVPLDFAIVAPRAPRAPERRSGVEIAQVGV